MYSIDREEGPLYIILQKGRRVGVGEGCRCGSVLQERKGMSVLECTAGKEMDVSVGEFSLVGKPCLCWSVQQKKRGMSSM